MLFGQKTNNLILTSILILLMSVGLFSIPVYGSSAYNVGGNSYELTDDAGFDITGKNKLDYLSYGKKSVGSLVVVGDFVENKFINGYTSFGAIGDIQLSYSYDGTYQSDNKESWNLCESSEKSVAGLSIDKKTDLGVVVVQKSYDGANWETVASVNDLFFTKKENNKNFYTISEDDLRKGTYYKVYVAYRMERKTGTEKTAYVFNTDVYEYKNFVESYAFFVGYDANAVKLLDLQDGSEVSSKQSVSKGFIIDKQNTNCNVTISKDGGYFNEVSNLMTINEPGNYNILITSLLGKEFKYEISVTEGYEVTCLKPSIYEGDDDWEYDINCTGKEAVSYGLGSLTTLKIAQQANSRISETKKGQFDAYGITGKSVSLLLHLVEPEKVANTGWNIYPDTWGKKEKQTVDGIWAGTVGSGALIIQKSSNGQDWVNLDNGAYANGLYTTDFYNYYGNRGDVLVYTPDGNELLSGIYIRVIYAYEVNKTSEKLYNRCIEEYRIYLCSNELNSVTFHNVSLNDKIEEIVGEEGNTDITLYKKAETLVSGSGTTTGFIVDTSLNPTVSYSIKRDGQAVNKSYNDRYTVDGKYEITLKSAVGDEEKVVIYVDTQDSEEALNTYFGDSFINGKRIYSDGQYPVYEGGVSSYYLAKVDDSYLPLSGEIRNTTTGDVINIGPSRAERTGKLIIPGSYVATFSTAQKAGNNITAGDYRVFSFNFEIIEEGTAPGPQLNQKNLADFSQDDISDAYPLYYALTYSSALRGNITLAFATEEAAREYAYNYEKGMVEQQEDGTYRYTGSFIVSQKESYDDAWALTDAINYFADQAVKKSYFDLSVQYTFVTLEDSVIKSTSNLRTKELAYDVTIFAGETQKKLLCNKENQLPVISPKPYAYLTPGKNGTVKSGYHDFEFVHDKYGCDSNSVKIFDCNGKKYNIEYNKGVGEQLAKYNCPSGIVTIVESTVYGDEATYEAVYIANNDNTGKVSIKYFVDGIENKADIDINNAGETIKADAFSIESVTDPLDPYTLVRVSRSESKETHYLVADQTSSDAWVEQGEYTVTVINRLGYMYSFKILIKESTYAAITFLGNGTENVSTIVTEYGEKNVQLPELTREGYEFGGYTDEEGTLYSENIEEILFKGNKVLSAVWKPKEITITLKDTAGNVIDSFSANYGTPVNLSNPKLEEGYTFEGWLRDGNLVPGNTFIVDQVSDIEFIAVVSGGEGSGVIIEKKHPLVKVIFILVVLLGLLCGGFRLYNNKRVDSIPRLEVKEEQSDEQNN